MKGTVHRVAIDGVDTTLTYDQFSGARGHQYLTPGAQSSHAFGFLLSTRRPGSTFRTNGHRYVILPDHDVPKAGTLDQISYCRRCGAAFNSTEPCVPRKVQVSDGSDG